MQMKLNYGIALSFLKSLNTLMQPSLPSTGRLFLNMLLDHTTENESALYDQIMLHDVCFVLSALVELNIQCLNNMLAVGRFALHPPGVFLFIFSLQILRIFADL